MSDYGIAPPPPPGYGFGGPPQGQPATPPPPNYLVFAILTTLFCCLPLGIASIVFSAQVNSKYAMGDYSGALQSSAKARQFAIYSAIATGVAAVLLVVAIIAGLVPAMRAST